MKTQIQNDAVTVQIKTLGAELQSIREKDGTEYLWQGNLLYWSGRSPILFPMVGCLRNDRATAFGKPVHMRRHGFVRKMEFAVVAQAPDSIAFMAESSDATRKSFPFDFEFIVSYSLQDRMLAVGFTVRNTGSGLLPFCVGGHPAFNVPLDPGDRFEDYVVEFAQRETAICAENAKDGLLYPSRSVKVLDDAAVLPLKHSLFYNDALVFDTLRSRSVKLHNPRTGRGVAMDFDGFDYLGIWSAANDAPYVCLEPWTGTATLETEDDIFEHKRGITVLDPGATFNRTFTVTLLG